MDRAVSWLTTSRPLFISWLNIYNQSRVAICEVLRLCIYLTDAFEARILQTPVSQSAYFATQLITILVYCGREVQPMNSPSEQSITRGDWRSFWQTIERLCLFSKNQLLA